MTNIITIEELDTFSLDELLAHLTQDGIMDTPHGRVMFAAYVRALVYSIEASMPSDSATEDEPARFALLFLIRHGLYGYNLRRFAYLTNYRVGTIMTMLVTEHADPSTKVSGTLLRTAIQSVPEQLQILTDRPSFLVSALDLCQYLRGRAENSKEFAPFDAIRVARVLYNLMAREMGMVPHINQIDFEDIDDPQYEGMNALRCQRSLSMDAYAAYSNMPVSPTYAMILDSSMYQNYYSRAVQSISSEIARYCTGQGLYSGASEDDLNQIAESICFQGYINPSMLVALQLSIQSERHLMAAMTVLGAPLDAMEDPEFDSLNAQVSELGAKLLKMIQLSWLGDQQQLVHVYLPQVAPLLDKLDLRLLLSVTIDKFISDDMGLHDEEGMTRDEHKKFLH